MSLELSLILASVGFGLITYVITSWALMTIADRTKHVEETPSWFAWIPLLNLYLLTKVSGKPMWSFILALVSFAVPVIGVIVFMGIFAWWWSQVAEDNGYSPLLGLLMILPLVNVVVVSIIAWK